MAVDVGSAVGYLDLDISGFLNNWKTAQGEADSASKNIATKIGNNLSSAGKSLQSAGSTLNKTATVPLLGFGAAATKVTTDFDSAMSKVSAISGATGNDLTRLRDKAKEMGAETKFSATESAEAFTYMAMAGWKTEDMLDGISGIMSLAAADGLDLATTSDIVTDALTAFGLSAKDSGHFADVLAKASSNANTNVSLLGESFKYAAPVAGALGYSAEDTAIALGLMANAGIKGSQGGTALRSSLSRLIKPTDQVAAAMEKYNISMVNSDGTMKSLGGVMNLLRTNLGGLSEAEQAQAAAALFGQEAMSGMLSIINASSTDYQKLTDAIYHADGAAQQMADTMLDNFGGQLTLLKSALEGVAIQIGEILMPYLTKLVGKVQDLVSWFGSLSTQQKEQILKWAGIVAAAGPVLTIVGKLVSGFGTMFTTLGKIPGAISKVSSGFKTAVNSVKNVGEAFKLAKAGYTGLAGSTSKLGAALAGVTAPMLAIVAVIGVLIAAFVSLWKNNEEFRDKITEIWNGIVSMFADFFAQITEKINSLGFDFENFGEVLKALWQGLCDFLAPIFIGAFQYISDTLQTTLDIILGIVDFFISIFKGDWEGAWNAIKGIYESIWNGMVAWLQNVGNTLLGILDVICGWFGTTWDATWTSIKTFFVNIWNSIVSFFTTTWTNIKMTVTNALNSIKTFVSSSVDNIKSKITSGFNAAKSTVANVLDSIKSKFTSIWNNCTSIVSRAVSKLKSLMNFSWSLPKLKLPHLSISGRFSINPPSVPRFSISWYKKAMEDGMILNSPTIFGYNAATGQFLAGGEAGSETVVGTKSLLKMIKAAVTGSNAEVLKSIEMHFEALYTNFSASSERLVAILGELLESSLKYANAVSNIATIDSFGKGDGFDYATLAAYLADEFKRAPVQHNINVEMEDGDVYLDNERVGRKVAPVVSRVVAQGTS